MNRNYKHIAIILIIFILIICIGYLKIRPHSNLAIQNESILRIHYIDVGQGDSILIQINNKTMLIDSGPEKSKDALIKYLNNQNIKKIDYLIATHPHEDHIGNMFYILKQYEIGKFYAPKITQNTDCYKNMVYEANAKGKKIIIGKVGINLDLGNDVLCSFLAPNSSQYEDINNYSIVIKLQYKNLSFLFMGDAGVISENEMMKKNLNLECNVLKVGHHGSNSSTSQPFLLQSKPAIAIISCGKRNTFGHPSLLTLNKFKSANCRVFRTDLDGTIVLYSDGYRLFYK